MLRGSQSCDFKDATLASNTGIPLCARDDRVAHRVYNADFLAKYFMKNACNIANHKCTVSVIAKLLKARIVCGREKTLMQSNDARDQAWPLYTNALRVQFEASETDIRIEVTPALELGLYSQVVSSPLPR